MADIAVNSENTNTKELLGQGIRAYVLQDYNAAVTALSKASELLVAEHGDDRHESLADVYLYYGKALLGLSREESGALGDAVRNKDDSDDDDEVENPDAEEQDKPKEGADKPEENVNKSESGVTINGTVVSGEGKADEKDQAEENGKAEDGEPSASTSAGKTEETSDIEEDPTDLQVAWEVLELAKKIYEKRGEAGKRNLADTLVVLGEVSLESENFESGINDIKEGLRMQKELYPDDNRNVAETYYKLGVAYSTNTQIDEAIGSFQASLECLQRRITNLEAVENKEGEDEEELKEIKALIPDIEDKIVDMKSYKDETLKKILSAVTQSTPASTGGGTSSSTEADSSSAKPASNISHLVKRKRKLDEVAEETEKVAEASPAKKPPS